MNRLARLSRCTLARVSPFAAVLVLACSAAVEPLDEQNSVSGLSVEPFMASLPPGGTQAFAAVQQGVLTGGIVWSASAGTITSNGVYTAPNQVGSYVVQAKYGGLTGTATATVAASGTPQALYAAASAACAAMPLRSTGTTHYFCDCQSGSQGGCVAGNDANANASNNTLDCSNPAAPCRTFAAANATFKRMAAGDTVAFCKGGSFTQSGNTQWYNARCAPAADMRAPANTTTCDIRDYAPSWGGTSKPVLRQLTASTDMFQFYTTWTRGVRVLNLDMQGGGTGCGGTMKARAAFEVATASNVLVCNNTIGWWMLAGNNNAVRNPVSTGWDYYGNTLVGNSLDAFLGSGDNFTYEANYFEDNGSCTATSHVIYPAGDNGGQVENVNLKIINNWIRFVNTTCQGPMINGHGTYNGALFENNLIQAAKSNGGCWGMGLDPDSGYNNVVQYAKNFVIRRNWIESNGWHLIHCASCPGVIVEDNVLISTPASQNPLIAVPFANARTIQPDPITSGAIIRNNTIYLNSGSAGAAYGIYSPAARAEGSGYVVANNSIYMPNGGKCWSKGAHPASAFAYVGNNACFGGTYDTTPAGTWITANPQYTSPPTDLKPQYNSPLVGAGTSAYAPSVDYNLKPRPAALSIGAFEP